MNTSRIATSVVVLGCGVAMLFGAFHWVVNRVYVPDGYNLMLRYKGPLVFGSRKMAKPGEFAEVDDNGQPLGIGMLEQLRGPGRHFYCPIWWERTIVPDIVIEPGHVGIVTSKLGEALSNQQFLVDGELEGPRRARHKGILREVFGPGRYRVNPYGFEFKIVQTNQEKQKAQIKYSGWVEIPTGYVGVVTFKADNKEQKKVSGIQDDVLPPGIYPVNPYEQEVDIIEVGYRESSISTAKKRGVDGKFVVDESGEPVPEEESGISFPSNDGFPIQIDYTAIWGVMPKSAPELVRTFGTIEQAEQKVILPQSESICRNLGSKMGAVELLVGTSRQKFQDETTQAFMKILAEKQLELLYGLVRHIYIKKDIREPIQKGYVADELKLTRDEEQKTAKSEADLREGERKVDLETERIKTETLKMVASVIANGQKKSKEIEAATKQQVAQIDKQIADLDARRTIVLGEAKAKAEQLQQEARSQKFELAVEAFRTPEAYNRWQFAEGLPESIDLRLFYAGEGTLWTDLKSIVPTLPINPPTAPRPAK